MTAELEKRIFCKKTVEHEFDEKIVIQKILEVYDKGKNPMN